MTPPKHTHFRPVPREQQCSADPVSRRWAQQSWGWGSWGEREGTPAPRVHWLPWASPSRPCKCPPGKQSTEKSGRPAPPSARPSRRGTCVVASRAQAWGSREGLWVQGGSQWAKEPTGSGVRRQGPRRRPEAGLGEGTESPAGLHFTSVRRVTARSWLAAWVLSGGPWGPGSECWDLTFAEGAGKATDGQGVRGAPTCAGRRTASSPASPGERGQSRALAAAGASAVGA